MGRRWRRPSRAWPASRSPISSTWLRPGIPAKLAEQLRPLYLFLLNKWYFDELYDAVLVRPALRLARVLWQGGDGTVIDGVPNGLAALATDGSSQVVEAADRLIAIYAFAMLIGVVVLVSSCCSCAGWVSGHERR